MKSEKIQLKRYQIGHVFSKNVETRSTALAQTYEYLVWDQRSRLEANRAVASPML